ncbi:hypothetical protein E5D57_012210 [Metarhizium anisopliae]|nr:hypothetical protein E5D57_012210 [Metarhizium anisopliae]
MSPGTYTITTNGTVINIVVTQEIATPTSSTQVFVTMTETVVVTVSSASTWTASKSSSTATVDDDCYGQCNCSKIEDKDRSSCQEAMAVNQEQILRVPHQPRLREMPLHKRSGFGYRDDCLEQDFQELCVQHYDDDFIFRRPYRRLSFLLRLFGH